MAEIWVVEDEQNIRDILLYTLQSTGFAGKGFESAEPFFKELNKSVPDLVLLDIMLPGSDGMQILKTIKSNPETRDLPVIMTTAKGTEFDKIQALEEGADDYLVKPFGMMEMTARIKAVLRRCEKNRPEEVLEYGPLKLEKKGRKVFVDGEERSLTKKEFDLLELFMQNPRQAISRDDLLYQVWQTDFMGETRTVDVHIRTLRSKLEPYADLIETVRGIGYRLRKIE